MEWILLALSLGLGLAAASGFRVFLPPFLYGLTIRLDYTPIDIPVQGASEWMSSDLGLILLGSAMVLEILAYYVPWLDNLMDSIASPAAMLAGFAMVYSTLGDANQPHCAMDPIDNCRRRGIWHHPNWNRLGSGPFNDDHRRNCQPTGIDRRGGCMHILYDTRHSPPNSRTLLHHLGFTYLSVKYIKNRKEKMAGKSKHPFDTKS